MCVCVCVAITFIRSRNCVIDGVLCRESAGTGAVVIIIVIIIVYKYIYTYTTERVPGKKNIDRYREITSMIGIEGRTGRALLGGRYRKTNDVTIEPRN